MAKTSFVLAAEISQGAALGALSAALQGTGNSSPQLKKAFSGGTKAVRHMSLAPFSQSPVPWWALAPLLQRLSVPGLHLWIPPHLCVSAAVRDILKNTVLPGQNIRTVQSEAFCTNLWRLSCACMF